MTTSNKKKGDLWEIMAIQYLQNHWFHIRDTNYIYGNFWEIDIVAEKNEIYHFIEVKYRTNLTFGTPEEAITKSKLQKCRKSIEHYVLENNLSFEHICFDVITIIKWPSSHRLTHYKNIEI